MISGTLFGALLQISSPSENKKQKRVLMTWRKWPTARTKKSPNEIISKVKNKLKKFL